MEPAAREPPLCAAATRVGLAGDVGVCSKPQPPCGWPAHHQRPSSHLHGRASLQWQRGVSGAGSG
eukprot:scaffold41175_cov72-Phaeocystis_antarctica.AAC.1